jgi:transcription antitermination factor NusG
MLRAAENPPILSPSLRDVAQASGRWCLAHTKARAEKALAWDLLAKGIPYFLPLIPRTIVSGGRKRHALLPLFPSYVFFCGDEVMRAQAFTTDRICQTIPVTDQKRLVQELSTLHQALAANVPLDPHPGFATGQRCRVSAGPFQGFEGIVVRRSQTARLVLQVSMLGQGAAMEIESDLVEPIEPTRTEIGAFELMAVAGNLPFPDSAEPLSAEVPGPQVRA